MTATVNLAPLPKQRFTDSNGNPLSGGKVFTYAAGTTTKQNSYTDSTGGTPNANPVLLDSRGEASIWLDQSLAYKVTLAPANDTDPPTAPIWTTDNIPANNFPQTLATSSGTSLIGWIQAGVGTVLRTLQSWMRERAISVSDFSGADPTGATASDAAFASWATAIAGRKGIVPAGTWKLAIGNIALASGTTVEFAGANAVVNYTGTGSAFQILSAKNVNLHRPTINLSGVGAKGIDIQGGWFVNIFNPSIGGNGVANNQTAISIVSSKPGTLGFGSYMIEIHNPDLTPGSGTLYGISTAQTAADTVLVTHLNIYGGWSSNTKYPLYFRGLSTFGVYGFTPENCTDGINLASSHDGRLMPGEIDFTGYGINFPDATCSNITVVAPSHAGSAGALINRTNYVPAIYDVGEIRLLGNPSVANYYYSMVTNGSYGSPLTESAAGGGPTRTLRTYADGIGGQQLYYVKGLSGSGVAANNLSGTATFAAATTVAVAFGTAEPDASYRITHGGNPAGYMWVVSKTTNGFTLQCSASNSNSVDWALLR